MLPVTQPNLFAKETHMATAIEQEVLPPEATQLVLLVENDTSVALVDRVAYSAWYESLKADAPTDIDTSTKKGRDVAISYAAKIRSKKAGIDKDRLRLTKEYRDMVASVNAAGKEITEQLEALAIEVRAPVTAWEKAEEARIDACKDVIADFKHDMIIREDDTAESVRVRGEVTWNVELNPDHFRELLPEAQAAKDEAIATLKRALDRLVKEEADRAELERLRAEKEERDRLDALRRADEERAAEVRREEERRASAKREYARALIDHAKECSNGFIGGQPQAFAILHRELTAKLPPEINEELCGDMVADVEAARVAALARIEEVHAAGELRRKEAAERAEAERVENARREAAEAAHRETDRKAQEEYARLQREHQAELDRIAEIERQREAREAADRAETKRLADEQAEREADKALQRRLKTEAKEAMMACGASEDVAQKIVLAIRAKEIPHVVWEA